MYTLALHFYAFFIYFFLIFVIWSGREMKKLRAWTLKQVIQDFQFNHATLNKLYKLPVTQFFICKMMLIIVPTL